MSFSEKNTLRFNSYFLLDIDRIYHPWVIAKQPTLLGFVPKIDNMQLASGPVSVLLITADEIS